MTAILDGLYIYPGTVRQFQALMWRCAGQLGDGAQTDEGSFRLREEAIEPTIGAWLAQLWGAPDGDYRVAAIEAFEEHGEAVNTVVLFADGRETMLGYWPRAKGPPIGAPFQRFCETLVREGRLVPKSAADHTALETGEKTSLPDYVPKRAETRARFKGMYDLWLDMQELYREEQGWSHDDARLKLADFRARVLDDLGWGYSERRLQDVIRAGKEGYLS